MTVHSREKPIYRAGCSDARSRTKNQPDVWLIRSEFDSFKGMRLNSLKERYSTHYIRNTAL